MVLEPDVDDTEDAWNNAGSGVRYQITDNHVAITKNSHVGDWTFAYFTPAEFDELVDNFDNISGRFYNIRVEHLLGNEIDITGRDGEHIVHVTKEQLQDIADEWNRELSFVEYLKAEYGESLSLSIKSSDGIRYSTEVDAAIIKHNGLFNSSLARQIAADDSVSLSTTYITDSEWDTCDGAIVMGLIDER